MSDRVTGAPTLETRMDDVRAVMDAVGSRRAAFYGLSEGAAMSILFAATYPERTAALVVRNAFPRRMWAPDYPWGMTEEAYESEGERDLRIFGPLDRAQDAMGALGRFEHDEELRSALDLFRLGSSPGALEALHRMNKEIDIRNVLPAVHLPTLILRGSKDTIVPPELARYMASRIPIARVVELPGVGHLAFERQQVGAITAEVERFLKEMWEAGAWEEEEPDRVLATVLFTDIVRSTAKAIELGDRSWRELLTRHHAVIRRQLVRFRGAELDVAGEVSGTYTPLLTDSVSARPMARIGGWANLASRGTQRLLSPTPRRPGELLLCDSLWRGGVGQRRLRTCSPRDARPSSRAFRHPLDLEGAHHRAVDHENDPLLSLSVGACEADAVRVRSAGDDQAHGDAW